MASITRKIGMAADRIVDSAVEKTEEKLQQSKISAILSGKSDTFRRAFFEAYNNRTGHNRAWEAPRFEDRFMNDENLSNVDFQTVVAADVKEGKSNILDQGALCLFKDPNRQIAYLYVPSIKSEHLSDCIVLVVADERGRNLRDQRLDQWNSIYAGDKWKELEIGKLPNLGEVEAVNIVDSKGERHRIVNAEQLSYEQQADAIIQLLSRFDIDKATVEEQELMYQLHDCARAIIGYELTGVKCAVADANGRVKISQAYAETMETLEDKSLTESLAICERERDMLEVKTQMSKRIQKKELNKQAEKEDTQYKSTEEKRREHYKI